MQPQPTPSAMGFFRSLFDFSFSSLITTKIIKAVYVLVTVFVSLFAIIFLIAGLTRGGATAIAAIIIAPIGWLLYMVAARMSLELIIIIFRIGEDVRRFVGGPGTATGFSAPPAGGYPSAPGYPPPPPGGFTTPPPGL